MGMFDTIIFKCPKCCQVIEEQTKEGPCCLAQFPQAAVPVEVAAELAGTEVWCDICNQYWMICCAPVARTVPMHLVSMKEAPAADPMGVYGDPLTDDDL